MAARRAELTAAGGGLVQKVFCRLRTVPIERVDATARRLCRGDDEALLAVLRLLPHAESAPYFMLSPDEALVPPEFADAGRVIGGRWRVVRLIGAGEGGRVYEVLETETGAQAALKLIHGLSPENVRAMRREIALLRWLRIPGVVRLIDDGIEGESVYCVTELVEGHPFPGATAVRDWEALAPVAFALLDAVAAVHAAGVIHCDLKPQNVFVGSDGTITLLDLGISAETRSPFAATPDIYSSGSRHYAPIDQLRGGAATVRWDLHALGVMFFRTLSGRFPGPHATAQCAALPAPRRVQRVIASLIDSRRRRAPRSIRQVLHALRPAPRVKARRTRWSETDLRGRFAGPDLLLHLREDAAAELYRRTAGRAHEVEHEIGVWIRAGLAREENGLVVINRPAIERLRTLAAATRSRRHASDDPMDRLFAQALRRGRAEEVAQTARRVAARRLAQGRPSSALAVLFEGAIAARASGDPLLELSVLRDAATAAVRTAVSSELDRALLLFQRAAVEDDEVENLETVVRAALNFFGGRPRDALAALVPLTQSAASDGVLRIAWSVRNIVAHALGVSEEQRCVRGLRRWLRRGRVRGERSILGTAEGWLRYHESHFATAVALHRGAARTAGDAHGRVRCLLDAATAAIECRPTEARALAVRAQRLAASLRNPVHEGRAVRIIRSAVVRSGGGGAPDREFVAAAARLGLPSLAAGAALTEAVLAHRNGDPGAARELSMLAARTWGAAPLGDVARALAAAAGERLDDAALVKCRASASRALPAAVGMQVLALVSIARPAWRARLRRDFDCLKLPVGDRDPRRIRETMSIDEAQATLEL